MKTGEWDRHVSPDEREVLLTELGKGTSEGLTKHSNCNRYPRLHPERFLSYSHRALGTREAVSTAIP